MSLLHGRSPADRVEQAKAHCEYLRVAILRAPWAHLEKTADHPTNCPTPCAHEQRLRAQLDVYLDAFLEEHPHPTG
jgi:hypothetical protein